MKFAKYGLSLLAVAGGCLLTFSIIQAQEQAEKAEKAEKKPAVTSSEFKTVQQRVSYGFGMDIGQNIARNMKGQQIDVDNAALIKGITDAITGADSQVTDEDMQAALKIFQQDLIAKAKIRRVEDAKKRIEADPKLKAQAEKNTKEGEAFLKEHKAKEGVKTTESGLQYQVITEGKGKKPAASDVVTTHYHGTLPDGKVFDSSVERKQPATFSVEGVIDGWTEALQMMPVGSKWKLVIPADLAYGLSGSGGVIGPNQVLVFEVELLNIQGQPGDEEAPITGEASKAESPKKEAPKTDEAPKGKAPE